MQKFILRLFGFLFFSFIVYFGLIFIQNFTPNQLKPNINYKKGSYGHLYTRISDIKNYDDIDILFLGSSHTYRGFDTRIFSNQGYTTFNLGSSAQTPIQTKVLLDRYLDDLKPKNVIYEVFPGTLISDGVESSLDLIANDENDISSFKMALNTKNIKTYNTFLYAITREVFNIDEDFKEPLKKGKDTYISGGFVEKEIGYYEPEDIKQKKIIINDKQLKAFSDIVEMIKDKKINLILVYAPITKDKYNAFLNNKYYDSIMKNHTNQYYNFNKILSLNDTLHFYDSHHLNQKGVEIYNRRLINMLKNNYH